MRVNVRKQVRFLEQVFLSLLPLFFCLPTPPPFMPVPPPTVIRKICTIFLEITQSARLSALCPRGTFLVFVQFSVLDKKSARVRIAWGKARVSSRCPKSWCEPEHKTRSQRRTLKLSKTDLNALENVCLLYKVITVSYYCKWQIITKSHVKHLTIPWDCA